MDSDPTQKVFHSPLAGTWYPADKDELCRQMDGYLAEAPNRQLQHVCALILPHAGYRWSGRTAACGIRQLVGHEYHRVIVLGPTHRARMANVASVPDASHYETPLGRIPLDLAVISELKRDRVFQTLPQAHQSEHSVQIELPFLQRAIGDFQLVPIVVGQLDNVTSDTIAHLLGSVVDDRTLVVASSDFTHYGDRFGYLPFRDNIPENLRKLDLHAVDEIQRLDGNGFQSYLDRTKATICGRHSIGLLLAMLGTAVTPHLLQYTTSGELTGDYTSSVSYASIAFEGSWPKRPAGKMVLADEERVQLLKLARSALEFAVTQGKEPTRQDLEYEPSTTMQAKAGAFVTLHCAGRLRGCIGSILPTRSLVDTVVTNAINAGLRDYRFRPVDRSELTALDYEISVLTPPQTIASHDAFTIGQHGIILKKQGRSAVFLPQVAVEQSWSKVETLNQLARKAGLPLEAWREKDAALQVFEAIVFGEKREFPNAT